MDDNRRADHGDLASAEIEVNRPKGHCVRFPLWKGLRQLGEMSIRICVELARRGERQRGEEVRLIGDDRARVVLMEAAGQVEAQRRSFLKAAVASGAVRSLFLRTGRRLAGG